MIKYVFLKGLPVYTLESELENGRSGLGEISLQAPWVDQVRSDGSQTRVVAAETQKSIP